MSRKQKIARRIACLVAIRLGVFAMGFMIAMLPFMVETIDYTFTESFQNVLAFFRVSFGFGVMVLAFVPHADVIVEAFGRRF